MASASASSADVPVPAPVSVSARRSASTIRSTGSSAVSPRSTRRLIWPVPMMTGRRGSRLAMGGVKRGGGRHYNPPIDILILCTGNICRSPMAEALLRHKLELAGIDATVSSAGTWRAGEPAAPGSFNAMATRSLDLSAHRSVLLDIEAVRRADLVIAMAREHVREVLVLDPPSLAKTFTLKELVRRAEALGPTDLPFDRWLVHVGQGRQARQMLGASRDDDVADPIGQADDVFVGTANELDRLLDRLVPHLVATAKAA